MTTSLVRVISIGYLLLPTLFFSAAWFRLPYSVLLIIGYSYLFFLEIQKEKNTSDSFGKYDILFLFFISFLWTFCTGIAGLSYQTQDYWAHNAKYFDLVNNTWPIIYPEKNRFACYYFGFYLVPALLSKLIGNVSELFLFLWSFFGFYLGLSKIYIILKRRRIALLLFICIGGIGHTLNVILLDIFKFENRYFGFLIEYWSTFDQSLWVPNQVIPSIIVVGIFIDDIFIRKKPEESFFSITLLFIWAIFPAVIFIILYVLVNFNRINVKTFISEKINIANYILPAILFLPAFLYLSSSDTLPVNGFLWEYFSDDNFMFEYISGVLIDIVAYFIISLYLKREIALNFSNRFIFLLILALFLMSLYRIGVMNDWLIRGSIPLIMIISIVILKSLSSRILDNKVSVFIFLVFFFICSLRPMCHFTRSAKNNILVNKFSKHHSFYAIPYDKYLTTYSLLKEKFSEKEANQYLGKKNSIYDIYLSRK